MYKTWGHRHILDREAFTAMKRLSEDLTFPRSSKMFSWGQCGSIHVVVVPLLASELVVTVNVSFRHSTLILSFILNMLTD